MHQTYKRCFIPGKVLLLPCKGSSSLSEDSPQIGFKKHNRYYSVFNLRLYFNIIATHLKEHSRSVHGATNNNNSRRKKDL